jgi:hypothetical protein
MKDCVVCSALVIGVLASLAHATVIDVFVLSTSFDKADVTCSLTWTEEDYVGVQDVCQRLGDASRYGMTSVTGSAYIKHTCNGTHFQKRWYSDSQCINELDVPLWAEPLGCSYSSLLRANVKYSCDQAFTAARWSRYTDSACQTEDKAMQQDIVPLNFCRSGRDGRFENGMNGRTFSCGSSGLETTLWQNSDCTGDKIVKIDAVVGATCDESNYYGDRHIMLESGCPGGSSDGSSGPSVTSGTKSIMAILWIACVTLVYIIFAQDLQEARHNAYSIASCQ